jgi:hypothetical protein
MEIRAAYNIVLAIGWLNGFVSTEVQNSTFVLRLKFSAKNTAHRQYAARCAKLKTRITKKISDDLFYTELFNQD